MAQVYNQIQVDVRTSTQDIITAVQFDSASRFLDVTLTDNGVAVDLTDHEVRLFAKKADTTEYYADGEITAATTGRCQFELTDQMLAVAQDIEVQIITYYDNTEVLQAPVFTIHVVKSLITDSAVESSNEYGALVVLYQNLYEAYDLMTTMVQNIGAPSEIAEGLSIDTMWEAWEWMVDYTGNDLTELIQEALANASVQGVLDVIGTPETTGQTLFEAVEEVGTTIVSGTRYLGAKRLSKTVTASSSQTILEISGQGIFLGMSSSVNVSSFSNVVYTVDGLAWASVSATQSAIGQYRSHEFYNGGVMHSYNYYTFNSPEIHFNTSLKIVGTPGVACTIFLWYALYE